MKKTISRKYRDTVPLSLHANKVRKEKGMGLETIFRKKTLPKRSVYLIFVK